jgi:hypothetical protein
MNAHSKFGTGELLHNRTTNEDGLVTHVYHLGEDGKASYKVLVPVKPKTWASGYYVSDWAESNLELSNNAELRSSERPTTWGAPLH